MRPVFVQFRCTPGKTYEVADAIYDRVRQNYAAKGVDFDAALALFQSELTKVQP